MKNNQSKRFKNPYLWVGLIGVALTALNVDPTTLTSFGVLGDLIMDVISNPFKIGTLIMAILGVFVNPTSKGLTDN